MLGLCVMLMHTYFQWSRQSTPSWKTKLKKQNHVFVIRFLFAMLISSKVTSRVPFQFWSVGSGSKVTFKGLFQSSSVENTLPFPSIFTGLLSLLTCLKGANMCSAAKSDKNHHLANDKQKLPQEKFWQPCCVYLHSQFQAAETGLLRDCWLHPTCHAWFSFVMWFVRFNILHNISTVHWIILPPPTNKYSGVLMH